MSEETAPTLEVPRFIEVYVNGYRAENLEMISVDIDENGKPILVAKEGDKIIQCKFVSNMWVKST